MSGKVINLKENKTNNPTILVEAGVFVPDITTDNSSEHLLCHYSRVMAVSVCSLCRLNLLVPTPAWRLRLVPPPPHFFLMRDPLKERAGLLLPTILMVLAAGGVPAEGQV